MNPFSHTGLSISDSLKSVRKSVLIYETIIESILEAWESPYNDKERKRDVKERSSRGITRFINELTEKVDIQLLPKISRDQYEEILGICINGRL